MDKENKIMLVDDEWATIGSTNTVDRSFKKDTELNASIWHVDTVKALRSSLFEEHLGIDTSGLSDVEAFVSAPVHSSIAGATARGVMVTLPNGRHVPAVPIKAADEQPLEGRALFEDVFGGDWPTDGVDAREPKAIAQAARAAGLVGLGGAAFPTHVKLTRNDAKPIDTLLVNGCECEPYLTADYRVMVVGYQ